MDFGQALFFYIALLKIADAATVFGMWYFCWYLRFSKALVPVTKGLPNFTKYADVAIPLMLVFTAVFHLVGVYRRDRIHFGFRAIKKISEASFLALLVFVSILYFRGDLFYSRAYLLIFPLLVIPAILAQRALFHFAWRRVQFLITRASRAIMMGHGDLLEMYWQRLQHKRPYPIKWLGRLGKPDENFLPEVRYLGDEGKLREVLSQQKVDSIVVSYPTEESARYEPILTFLSNELVNVKVLPDFGRYSTFTYHAEDEQGIPLLLFNQQPTGASDRFVKRLLDILGSLAFLIVGSPLYLLIAFAIRITSRGPIFYSQRRMGADGKIFTLYKFRSMNIDAEKETGAVWATANDLRTTRLGKWLRRTSLDEIPQFFNVLRGDMSLVGPRPERPIFVEEFRQRVPKYMLRHKVKSGITGWAQVNGWRGNTSIEQRIKYDLFYIGHWSHLLDLKILLMTLYKGFVHRHAY